MNGTPWRPSKLDILLALATLVAGLVETFGRVGDKDLYIDDPWPWAVGVVITSVLMLLRRRFPLAAALELAASYPILFRLEGTDYPTAAWQTYSVIIFMYTVGATTELRTCRGAAGLGCVVVMLAAMSTVLPGDPMALFDAVLFVSAAYGGGILVRRQTSEGLRLAEHNARLEAEREERARRAVADERARIARELHDVVSHNVSVMTLQAGGVRLLLADDELDRERGLLSGVERAGRQAIDELRVMLGVLRDPGDPAEAAQPGLAMLDDLVAQVRAAGLDVAVRSAGPGLPTSLSTSLYKLPPLPPGLDLSAYRVIQEALTNVLKHARATRAEVTLTYAPAALTVRVEDDGPGPVVNTNGGHGLIGMRERTLMFGGELHAAPRPDGGYSVLATFPLGRGAAG